ncbi:hypothetical protein Dtox_1099 [Desulfofarcimen acetoxidans DSM 771]|uniref:Succinylglutamate desuccinylase/aspartoacylase n=1 Tax=Desulfofarcimen acetoxidans (strain ATCC 49208 / DSM 771 / KCTC 5769 / VKM B-1644 / 5575) TaxID=485916 RepID=C8W4B7_DESAS|nr:hypothetical protein [Desulfofarcimen acetoxidans]ACV61985.1 hypothetical protein Dtox_1099 [Desulfofarcimen acetoxidans DSM 771]
MGLVEDLLERDIPDYASKLECAGFYVLGNFPAQVGEAFLYLPGTLPILLSAPHAVRHVRLGKAKPSDTFTGTMAVLLNYLSGCGVLVNRRNYGGDPNYDRECKYKNFLLNILKKNNVELVLDLHGAAEKHAFAVDSGTLQGRSLKDKPELLLYLENCLNFYGVSDLSRDYFPAAKQHTVTRFVCENTDIPAIQLEINRRYRRPYEKPADFCRLLAALLDFSNLFKKNNCY